MRIKKKLRDYCNNISLPEQKNYREEHKHGKRSIYNGRKIALVLTSIITLIIIAIPIATYYVGRSEDKMMNEKETLSDLGEGMLEIDTQGLSKPPVSDTVRPNETSAVNNGEMAEMVTEPDIDMDNSIGDAEPEWSENGMYTEDIKIKVVDTKGNSVRNIAVRCEYLSGEYGSHQPGYAITGNDGEVMRLLHPNAKYKIYTQKLSCVSYDRNVKADIIRELVTELDFKGQDEVTIVWDEESIPMTTLIEKSLKIKVLDEKGYPVPELFVQSLIPYGKTLGQLQLGYTDENGIYVWSNYICGEMILTLQSPDFKTSAQYRATLSDDMDEKILVWTGENTVIDGEFLE